MYRHKSVVSQNIKILYRHNYLNKEKERWKVSVIGMDCKDNTGASIERGVGENEKSEINCGLRWYKL